MRPTTGIVTGPDLTMATSHESLRTRLRHLPRTAWYLFAGTFINRFGTFLIPFLVLYLTRRGFTLDQAGWAVSCYGAGQLAASLIGGYAADHLGRRNTIILSMTSSAVVMLILSQAATLPLILLLTGMAGLTSEMYRPAASALIADLVAPEGRVTAFAVYRLAINAGFALGPATAGFLVEKSFVWIFIGDAVTSLLFAMLAWRTLPAGNHSETAPAGWRETWTSLRHNRAFLVLLVATYFITFNYFQLWSALSLHIRDHGYPSSDYGLLASLNGLLIILLELPLTGFTQRMPPRRAMALGFLLLGLGYFCTQWAPTVPLIAATVCVWTLGEMISAPVASAFAANLAPANLRGRFMGMISLTWSLGLISGPTVGLRLYQAAPSRLWTVCGLTGLTAAALILIEPRPGERS